MKKKILITGINGFLGSHLAKKIKNNFEIIGIEYSTNNLWRLEGETFKIYSYNDQNLAKVFEENIIFAIIHAATVYRKLNDSIIDILNTNVIFPIKLYELANKHNVSIFLNTDSFFNDKKHQYSYLSEYTQSKNQVLDWLKLINLNSSCKLLNMKIFHMYGPYDALTKFIPQIITKLRENIPFIDLTSGNQTRDFIFIDDVVSAFEICLVKYKILENFEEFEIGTGREKSIKEFVQLIKDITNSTTELRFGELPYREGEIMESSANCLRLEKLGWIPLTKIKKGISCLLLE